MGQTGVDWKSPSSLFCLIFVGLRDKMGRLIYFSFPLLNLIYYNLIQNYAWNVFLNTLFSHLLRPLLSFLNVILVFLLFFDYRNSNTINYFEDLLLDSLITSMSAGNIDTQGCTHLNRLVISFDIPFLYIIMLLCLLWIKIFSYWIKLLDWKHTISPVSIFSLVLL